MNKKGKSKFLKRMLNFSLIIFLPCILMIGVEIIHRGSFLLYIDWVEKYKNEAILNYILYFGVVNTFFIINRRFYLICFSIVSTLLIFIVFISYIKESYRGEPLIPWDFMLGKEAADISVYLQDILTAKVIIIAIILLIILLCLCIIIPAKKFKFKALLLSIVSFFLVCNFFFYEFFEDKFGIQVINWDQGLHYNHNGFLYGFVLNAKKLIIEKPEGYSEIAIQNIVENTDINKYHNSGEKPNIIYIMSEAFWDPTLMGNVSFSEDPIPFFHSLQEKYTNGTMLSPIYGGGTVNTEFEALTGFSTQFLPPSTVAYSQYVHEPMHSISWVLKNQGYETTAVHSYSNWFYRRNEVYKLLGFDQFIPAEFFVNPTKQGTFITDIEMSKVIVDKLKGTNGPDFIHAVSMEAHGPYPADKNKENTIKVSGEITDEARSILETYSQNIRGADDALKYLISEIEKLNEPTVILFFGDHLPMLGNDYQLYKETDFFYQGHSYDEYLKMYSMPFVIWDNISLEKEELRMTPNFFSPYILNVTQNRDTKLFSFLEDLYESGVTVIPKSNYYKEENINPSSLDDYKMVQYDLMFGENYFKDTSIKPNINENYHIAGSKSINVQSIYPNVLRADTLFDPKENKNRIYIQGANFPNGVQVFVNDKPQPTNVVSGELIRASVPSEFKNGEIKLELKVVDVLGNALNALADLSIKQMEDQEIISEIKNRGVMEVLDGSLNWEPFVSGEGYKVVRVKINTTNEKRYVLYNDKTELKHGNADEFNAPNMSDIYENGYLYISISDDDSQWKEMPGQGQIKSYFDNNPYELYIEAKESIVAKN